MSNPRVSVIIPVHNSERYLEECLTSVLAQTERSIEVICVDDGSTDGSAALLDDFARADERVSVIHQEAQGAGAARNVGMGHAKGTYLSFLDSDDFFESEMLQETADAMDRSDADVCVFGSWVYDEGRKANRKASWNLRTDLLPKQMPFSWEDLGLNVFDTCGNCVWNKLFRREFVHTSHLAFQQISRANDLFFSCASLIFAKRVTVVDRHFVHYRIATQTSLQSTNDRDPLSFLDAFDALYGLISEVQDNRSLLASFGRHLLDAISYNADSLRSIGGLVTLKDAISERVAPTYGQLLSSEQANMDERSMAHYESLRHDDLSTYLFQRTKALQAEREDLYWLNDWREWKAWKLSEELGDAKADLESANGRVQALEDEVSRVRASTSYRLGHALLQPVRHVRDGLHRS